MTIKSDLRVRKRIVKGEPLVKRSLKRERVKSSTHESILHHLESVGSKKTFLRSDFIDKLTGGSVEAIKLRKSMIENLVEKT